MGAPKCCSSQEFDFPPLRWLAIAPLLTFLNSLSSAAGCFTSVRHLRGNVFAQLTSRSSTLRTSSWQRRYEPPPLLANCKAFLPSANTLSLANPLLLVI